MSTSTHSTGVGGVRKRPRRMRVKKYNVDVSNSISSIDMAGRIDSSHDYTSTTGGSVDLSTINDIERIHLASLGEPATPPRTHLASPGEAATPPERDVKIGRAAVSDDDKKKSIPDTSQTNNAVTKPSAMVSKPSANRSRPSPGPSKPGPSRFYPRPPRPTSSSSGRRSNLKEQDDSNDDDSTRPQHSMSSSDSSSGSSSSSSGYSVSDSDDSTSEGSAGETDDDSDKASSYAVALRPFSTPHAEQAVSQDTLSTSTTSSLDLATEKYQYPDDIYQQTTTGDKTESEPSHPGNDDGSSSSSSESVSASTHSAAASSSKGTGGSSHGSKTGSGAADTPDDGGASDNGESSRVISDLTEPASKYEGQNSRDESRTTTNPSEQAHASKDEGQSSHDESRTTSDPSEQADTSKDEGQSSHDESRTTSDQSEQDELSGRFNIYHQQQQSPETTNDAIPSNEGTLGGTEGRKNDDGNEISQAIRNLKPPSKAPRTNVDSSNYAYENTLPYDEGKERIKPKTNDSESNDKQDYATENQGLTTATADPAPPPPADDKITEEGSYQSGSNQLEETPNINQSVEANRPMDKETRFQLWLEQGIYVPPPSNSQIPSESSKSDSRSLNEASVKDAVVEKDQSKTNWWKRMLQLLKPTPRPSKNSKKEAKESLRTEQPEIVKSLADQVAAAAKSKKKSNRQIRSAEDFEKLCGTKTESKDTGGSLADQVAAAAHAVKSKNKSAPMTEEDYDKLYAPKKKFESKGSSLADQVAAAAIAVKQKKQSADLTEEDYDKLYDPKKQRQDKEPRRMFDLKPAKGGKPPSRRKPKEQPETSACSKLEEGLETSMSSSFSVDNKASQSKKIPNSSKSSSSRTHFKPTGSSESKRRIRFCICCFLFTIFIVIITAIPVYFLVFADNQNDRDVSKAPSANDATRFPSKSPSFSSPVKPTNSIPNTRSPMPTYRRPSNLPASQPISQPVSDPTLKLLPTSTPTSIALSVSPTQPYINVDEPSQSPNDAPIIIPTSVVFTNQPVSPTQKPIATELPTNSPTKNQQVVSFRQVLASRFPPLLPLLNVPSSPQSKAFEWLVNLDPDFDQYSETQLIQRFAMATFFFSTNGEKWANNDGWLSAENECQWYQTRGHRDYCDNSGRLLNLELTGNALSGNVPSELALLSNSLVSLDFSKNSGTDDSDASIRGSLPSEIGLMTMLQYVSLSNQEMTGTVPAEISNLSLLSVLDLERNNFEGPLMANIGNLKLLYNLYLGFNYLSGTVSSEIGNLQFLVNLGLQGNRFSSTLPSELGELPYLQSLSLSNNKLTGTIPSFLGRLSNLRGSLDLSDNLLNGTIPTHLGQLTLLRQVLNLSSNELSGPIPVELDRLKRLGNLQLQDNLLTGNLPPSFNKLTQLQTLQIQFNNLTGDVAGSVCDALVTDKIENRIAPTSLLSDCPSKVDCECCQYCCSEGIGCECQFRNTNQEFLCPYGKTLGPEVRIASVLN